MYGNHSKMVVGNLTADPELRFADNGTPVVSFTIAVNTSNKKDDPRAKTIYHRCKAFNTLAENIAESLTKGVQVVAILTDDPWERTFETADGEKKVTQLDYIVDEIGASLRFATAKVTKRAVNHDDRPADHDDDRDNGRRDDRGSGRDDDRDNDRRDERQRGGRDDDRGGSDRGGSDRGGRGTSRSTSSSAGRRRGGDDNF